LPGNQPDSISRTLRARRPPITILFGRTDRTIRHTFMSRVRNTTSMLNFMPKVWML